MRAKIGIILMMLGLVLVASALGLFIHNQMEEDQAAASSNQVMPQIVDAINERQQMQINRDPTAPTASGGETPVVQPTEVLIKEMSVVDIDGYGYIGFVGIPALNLELPVMADWSYPQLKIAPCRYTGSTYTDDLVVMAHNYKRHFGDLSTLRVGDTVTFTDMDGETITYEVMALDVLSPTAVEEMTAGEYDLTLFTCTYGGGSRVTIRCDRVEE